MKRMSSYRFSKPARELLKKALREDLGRGDITTRILIPPKSHAQAVIVAKEKGVLCGAPIAGEIFRMLDKSAKISFSLREGRWFRKGEVIAKIRARTASILGAERTALNFLGLLSGVATETRRFVDRVKPYPVLIWDTRKTIPLLRDFEKYAVRVGGGHNHRRGLFDAAFVKENHRRWGNLGNLRKYRGRFEIEVRNLRELKEALALSPGVILFDNFSPKSLARAVCYARSQRPGILLEASGGITLKNVRRYAASGVNWISVGALTHSVKTIDFSVLIL